VYAWDAHHCRRATIALDALAFDSPGRISAEGLADCFCGVMMKPEFQLIY